MLLSVMPAFVYLIKHYLC